MSRTHLLLLLRIVAVVALAIFGHGQDAHAMQVGPVTPQVAVLTRLFQEPIQRAWFDPPFLAKVTMASVEQLIRQMIDTYGPLRSVTPSSGGSFAVVLERGTVPAQVAIDSEGRVIGLLLGSPVGTVKISVDAALSAFTKLTGRIGVSVVENGRTRAGFQSDRALAVGSTFKLAVLGAIATQIAAGARAWTDVVTLQPDWKSLPSGTLQTWPDETPLTLATLANQMISISDNTGADALLALAGRDAVEAEAPRNRPFLTTREAFVLKAENNKDLLQRFRAADQSGKRGLLAEIARRPLPSVSQLTTLPNTLDVEWYFTTDELCQLMAKVADAKAFSIEPGIADPDAWARVSFKGGAEPGVLNYTTALSSRNGQQYCVAATWNDEARLDEARFRDMYVSLIRALE